MVSVSGNRWQDGAFFLEFYDLRDAMRYRTPKARFVRGKPRDVFSKTPIWMGTQDLSPLFKGHI